MDRTRRGILAREALSELTARGWKLWHSPPPYVDELPLPILPRRPPLYSLLILDAVTGPSDDAFDELGKLGAIVSKLRRGFLMPVFVRLAGAPTGSVNLAFQDTLAAAGAELLLPEQIIGRRAFDVLTMRRNLASDWPAIFVLTERSAVARHRPFARSSITITLVPSRPWKKSSRQVT